MALGHVFWENCLTGLKRSKANNFCPLLLQHHPLFFSRTATQAYLLNREGMVYTRGHLMLTEMFQRFLVLFVFFGQLLLLSMQSPVKDGFRLEA
jgi:hypothetical protein